MSKAQLVITAVVLEGRSKSEVAATRACRGTGCNNWSNAMKPRELRPITPRPRQPHHNSHAIDAAVEDAIVGLRKTLTKQGYDAGAATITEHLTRDRAVTKVPAVATIWRVLSRRGFIVAQPDKRPRSAWKRFCADQPNELWQADVTHWHLAEVAAKKRPPRQRNVIPDFVHVGPRFHSPYTPS